MEKLKLMEKLMKEKHSTIKTTLTVVFVACLVVSNIIAGKQVQLPLGLTMPGAVFIFPVTYILSDIFSEVYGYKWSRLTNYLGIICNLIAVFFFICIINAPSPEWYELDEAFASVLGQTPKMLVASILGLWLGDFINDNVFRIMKKRHPDSHEGYGARAIISSVFGQLGDSIIFIPIAFYGQMPFKNMIMMIFTQAGFKVLYELIILPLSTFLMKKLSNYEKRPAQQE